MKQPFLIGLLAVATFFYFYNSSPNSSAAEKAPGLAKASAQPAAPLPEPHFAPAAPVIASLPSYSERWKTGPNAQTDLKAGPNAQTDFEPFAPSEQANWNNTPGYSVISGVTVRK